MKKSISILLFIFMFFFVIGNVKASTISVNDLVEKAYEGHYNPLEVDSANHVIKYIDEEDGEIFSINYTNNYLEYNPNIDEAYMARLHYAGDGLAIKHIIEAMIELSGFEGKNIIGRDNFNYNDNYTNTYDEYGLMFNEEHYDNSSSSYDYDPYVKNFKMSLNTEDIAKLVNRFGYTELMYSETELNIKNITPNSVTLTVKVNNDYFVDDIDHIYCDIYRSENETSGYEKIKIIKCNGTTQYTDENLTSNKTYYYKSVINDGYVFNNPLKVTIKDARIPTLKASHIDEESVRLTPKVDGDITYCYIYRSKGKDSVYTLVDKDPIICNGQKSFTDDELKSDTTYYYKALVANGYTFSKSIKVTTDEIEEEEKEETTTTSSSNNETPKYKNPNTGAFLPSVLVIIMIIGAISTILYFKKKSLFRKI